MSYIKIINDNNKYYGYIIPIDEHTIEVQLLQKSENGFTLHNDRTDKMIGDYSDFIYFYRKVGENVYQYTNDNHEYVEPTIEEPITEPIELTKEELAEQERQLKISNIQSQIDAIDTRFKELDYIGIKIATGRATLEEYVTEIEEMKQLAEQKDALE